jgi:hypothetical protein
MQGGLPRRRNQHQFRSQSRPTGETSLYCRSKRCLLQISEILPKLYFWAGGEHHGKLSALSIMTQI